MILFYEGSYKKNFLLNPGGYSIIEGIGSLNGLFEPLPDFPLDFHVLTCFVTGDSGISDYPSSTACPLVITTIQEAEFTRENITLFPNPLSDFSTIKFPKDAFNESQILIYNTIGEIVLSKFCINDEIKIYRDELKPGLYIVEVSTDKFRKKSYIKLIVH